MRNNFKFNIICFTLILLFKCGTISSQSIVYEGFIKGHKVGEMKVEKIESAGTTTINISTHIEAHMLIKVIVDYTSSSTYANNALTKSEAKTMTNGHLKESVEIKKVGNSYLLQINGKDESIDEQSILGADLYYFEVSEDGSKLYSLATGKPLEVVKSNASTFFFEHDGKKESHVFSNNQLSELSISHKLYTIHFKKKQ